MNLNRTDYQRIAEIRLADATALLKEGQYDGAYYIAGYAVECALKACIAKQTRLHDFPPRKADKYYTHDLNHLLEFAALRADVDQEKQSLSALGNNWVAVLNWSEQKRYDYGVSQQSADELVKAIGDAKDGVMSWLRLRW